ncbi:hypothetical protein JAB9_10150 [Janthinobacterium sp. HH107]|nr:MULTISPECIES: hypothetical protein [Janthinobacterium]OEZ93344.1 hypothetical protein JAB8_04600 [Janthinobacterium sp. HH106]OFA05339.1 hypothetical protein JAB9_10150 [Janthinobacterium sp. HH107]
MVEVFLKFSPNTLFQRTPQGTPEPTGKLTMKLIQHELIQVLETGAIPPTLAARLRNPDDRLAMYGFIVDRKPQQFRQLLLRLFDEEIAFRNALWDGTVKDNGAFSECIYHCAFLLYCCAEPSDTVNIWRAQYLNQDIGELDGWYFIGAGLNETLSYLERTNDQTSAAIAEYIENWSSYISPDSLSEWQQGRRNWILDDVSCLD